MDFRPATGCATRIALALLLALPLPAGAGEAQIDAEMQALLLRLGEAGRLPAPGGPPLRIERPERVRYELGAVVDVRGGQGPGLAVLAVTPGSAAERLGLRVGDRLLAINDHTFSGEAPAAETFRAALAAREGALALRVRRGERELNLSGQADRAVVPAYTLTIGASAAPAATPAAGCGRISTFDVAPRAQHIYPAVLIAIDGRQPGPAGADSFRLDAGRHVLTVAEAIDAHQFTAVQQYQRDRARRERYKTLTIEVRPNTTYRLGARLIGERRGEIRDNAYWEPVIWAEVAEACR